eukprot:8266360-Pyramimonas_sp.AAC.1
MRSGISDRKRIRKATSNIVPDFAPRHIEHLPRERAHPPATDVLGVLRSRSTEIHIMCNRRCSRRSGAHATGKLPATALCSR